MVRMLHLADLHLGWEPTYLPGDRAIIRQEERDSLLQRAVAFALEDSKNIQLVIIAGDLFERHDPPAPLVNKTLDALGRLVQSGRHVITVPGNHDEISYHNSVYRQYREQWPGHLVTAPMPAHVLTLTVGDVPVHVYSMAYTGGLTDVQNLTFPRSAEEGWHIASFHGSLDWETGDRSLPLPSAELAKADYDYLALGHIHRHQVLKVGNTCTVYAGIMEPKMPTDSYVSHYTVAQLRDSGVEIETPPETIRPHQRHVLDISGHSTPQALMDDLRAFSDAKRVMHIELRGAASFPFDPEALVEHLYDEFFHLEIDNESDFISPAALERYHDDLTVKGEFVRRMHSRLEETEDPDDREILQLALVRGLAAFERGARR